MTKKKYLLNAVVYKSFFWFVCFISILAITYFYSYTTKTEKNFPNIEYTLLNGSIKNSHQWRGKVTLIYFWSTNCYICIKELPQLKATHEKFKNRRYDTLAIAMGYDSAHAVKAYAQAHQLPFSITIDSIESFSRAFGEVRFTPTLYILNSKNIIVQHIVGMPNFEALHKLIEKEISKI